MISGTRNPMRNVLAITERSSACSYCHFEDGLRGAMMREMLACSDATPFRPFGMRLAVIPKEVVHIDPSSMKWDAERQIMVMQEGGDLAPAFRHTSTQTSTTTATQDRSGDDTDTDATGR